MCAMEGMIMKKHTYSTNPTSTTSPPLSMHRDSHMISKGKPKIRIIHIFAPEIIKTDVANFRELVQRLTGKPAEKKKSRTCPRKEDPNRALVSKKLPMGKKREMRTGFRSSSELRERIKGEEEIWGGANSGGGFLGGFADLDGFMHELNQEFPLLPTLDANSHLDSYGEKLNLPAYS